MESRQFEWTFISDVTSEAAIETCLKNAEAWTPLHPLFLEAMISLNDPHLDWFLGAFGVFLPDMPAELGQYFVCEVAGRFAEDIYAYRLRCYDDDDDVVDSEDRLMDRHLLRLSSSAVALREVPSGLVVNCDLSTQETRLEAIFTTLTGREFYRLDTALGEDGLIKGAFLMCICSEEAMYKGLLKSKNQELRIFLNGSKRELQSEAVVWSRCLPRPASWPEQLDQNLCGGDVSCLCFAFGSGPI